MKNQNGDKSNKISNQESEQINTALVQDDCIVKVASHDANKRARHAAKHTGIVGLTQQSGRSGDPTGREKREAHQRPQPSHVQQAPHDPTGLFEVCHEHEIS
jgi:hypothetical protein